MRCGEASVIGPRVLFCKAPLHCPETRRTHGSTFTAPIATVHLASSFGVPGCNEAKMVIDISLLFQKLRVGFA